MAINYKSSLNRYRRYLAQMQQQPLMRASFLLVLSLVLLIILLLLVLRPTLITISGLLGQIKTQQQVDARLDAKIAALQQAQTLLNSLQPRLVSLDNSLPTAANLGIWSQAVQALASGSGIAITQFTIADIPYTNIATSSSELVNLTNINFDITVSGDYTQLADFIDTLEKLPRLAILESVQVTKGSEGILTLSAQGTISFTYAQKGY